jgi:transposase, IS30 family
VSQETIYQSLCVQGRGLARCLRSVRAARRPHRGSDGRGKMPGMVMISERAAEAADRAVPGHWEGDLVIGKGGKSAVGTLAERTTRSVMLSRRPGGHGALAVSDAMAAAVTTLPAALARSVTWDQGPERHQHAEFTLATGSRSTSPSPTHPGSADQTRTPTGCSASTCPKAPTCASTTPKPSPPDSRPRMTLCWMTPSEKLAELIALTA